MKSSKIAIIILSVALLLASVIGISISAEEATPTLEIYSKNLSYGSNISIAFAVKSENIGDAEVKLNVYEADPTVATVEPAATVSKSYEETVHGELCDIFFTPGINAKSIHRQVYVQAFAVVGEDTYYSEVERYSVLEYCYEMIADEDTDAAKDAKFQAVIDYGVAIQSLLKDDGKFEGAFANEYKYVTIAGGTLDGKYNVGVYLAGTKLNPSAEGVSAWSDGNVAVLNGAEYTVTDNATLVPANADELAKITFENVTTDTIPSCIEFVDTHPVLPFGTNTYASGKSMAKVDTITGNATKSLVLDSSRSYTRKNILKISETASKETNANAVEFSMDFMVDWSTSGTGAEFINVVFTDKNGNVAFNLILCQSTATGLQLRFRDNTGAQPSYVDPNGKSENYGRTFLSNADGVWTNLTLKYVSDGNTMALSVARGDTEFFVGSLEPGAMVAPFSSNCIKAEDITNAYVIVNGHSSASHTLNNTMAIDNLTFRKIAE